MVVGPTPQGALPADFSLEMSDLAFSCADAFEGGQFAAMGNESPAQKMPLAGEAMKNRISKLQRKCRDSRNSHSIFEPLEERRMFSTVSWKSILLSPLSVSNPVAEVWIPAEHRRCALN